MKKAVGSGFIFLAGFVLLMSFLQAAEKVKIRAFFNSSFTDTDYQQKVISKVNANWKSSDETAPAGAKVVYVLKLDRNGVVGYKKLLRSSDNTTFDKDAGDCLDRSIPFDPLPASYRNPYLEIHFHFKAVH